MIDRKPEGLAVLCGAVAGLGDLTVSFFDPAAQWGLGVFETIAVSESEVQQLDEHLFRLSASALRLGVPLPANSEWTQASRIVAKSQPGPRAWLKLLASRSGRWAAFGGPLHDNLEGRAVSVVVLPWRRHRLDPVVGIKSLGYAAAILGLEEARRRGADDGLWLNERGHVMAACTANVFVVRGRAVVTPALGDGARDGVTRSRAIGVLRAFGLSVRQSKVRIATLRGADEVFLTSSLGGVRPVVRIDGRAVRNGLRGPISCRLAAALARRSGVPAPPDGNANGCSIP